MSELKFPLPLRLHGGRLYWRRSELEKYKRDLIRAAGGNVDEYHPDPRAPEEFVHADQVAREFGFGRRTLGRRVAGFDTEVAA